MSREIVYNDGENGVHEFLNVDTGVVYRVGEDGKLYVFNGAGVSVVNSQVIIQKFIDIAKHAEFIRSVARDAFIREYSK